MKKNSHLVVAKMQLGSKEYKELNRRAQFCGVSVSAYVEGVVKLHLQNNRNLKAKPQG